MESLGGRGDKERTGAREAGDGHPDPEIYILVQQANVRRIDVVMERRDANVILTRDAQSAPANHGLEERRLIDDAGPCGTNVQRPFWPTAVP